MWLLLSLCLNLAVAFQTHCVIRDNAKNFVLTTHCGPNAFATGYFVDEINQTGWARLSIKTNPAHPDSDQAYAAGFFEGGLTVQRSFEYLTNVRDRETGYTRKLATFVAANVAWVKEQIHANQDDVYWKQVALIFRQLDGLYDGYSAHAAKSQQVHRDVFYAAQLEGDLDDLCVAFGCEGKLQRRISSSSNSHCSVLIKVLPSMSDILIGHTTWSAYETMTRIYKVYDFGFHHSGKDGVPGRRIFFSSYPTLLYSLDDYYQINNGLVVTETTIENKNESLWNNVKATGQVANWIRTMVASRLAKDGAEWMKYYERYNSGTYNNQWMVLDYKKFRPSEPHLRPGTLWVGEQMPGYFVKQDMTGWLNHHKHWVSYNRPFFPFIFNISGQPEQVEKYGDHFSWSKTARAVIFQHKQGAVHDQLSYRKLIRYNNFEVDEIATQGCSRGRSASNAISERGDLTHAHIGCIDDVAQQDEGGTDAKYTSYKMTMEDTENQVVVAQSGPTHDIQPPFVWSKSPFAHVDHIGQPDLFAFPWVVLKSADNKAEEVEPFVDLDYSTVKLE